MNDQKVLLWPFVCSFLLFGTEETEETKKETHQTATEEEKNYNSFQCYMNYLILYAKLDAE